MYTTNKEKTALTLQERIAKIAALEKTSKPEEHHYSDGSELIPAEIPALYTDQLSGGSPKAGYTVDDEGLVNAYTIEPVMYLAGYPTSEEQRRYIFQGVIAALLVALTVLIGFSV